MRTSVASVAATDPLRDRPRCGRTAGAAEAVLRLQRTAGNRAVCRALAPRKRMLQRATDDPGDIALYEQHEDLTDALYWLQVRTHLSQLRFGAAIAQAPAVPSPVWEWGLDDAPSRRRRDERLQKLRERRTAHGPYAAAPELQVAMSPRRSVNRVAVNNIDPNAVAQARTRPATAAAPTANWGTDPLQAGIGSPYLVPGLLPNNLVPVQPIAGALTTGPAHRGTGEITKVKRRGRAPGTLTRADVRPPLWMPFKTLFHASPRGGRGFIMGHLLNKHLGGLGDDMSNLAPFTYRLNHDHSVLVEEPIKQWVLGLNTPSPQTTTPLNPLAVPGPHWVDYKVTPQYMNVTTGNPLSAGGGAAPAALDAPLDAIHANIVTWQNQWFAGHPQDAADLLTFHGLLPLADQPTVLPELANGTWRNSFTLLSNGQALSVIANQVNEFIKWYVARHFPHHIICRVRLYEDTPAGPHKSDTLEVTLPNHP